MLDNPTRIHRIVPSDAGWTVIDGVPGAWRRLRTRVAVSARSADGLRVDGQLVHGLQMLRSDADRQPSVITAAGLRVEVLEAPGAPLLRVVCA